MISTTLKGWKWELVVKALQLLKGIKELTAVVLVSVLGDIGRFEGPRQLMALPGVITMEYTSSENR